MTSTKETPSIENLYHLDGKISVKQAVPFGPQHILAMFVSNIAPIFIVAGASGLSSQDTAMLIQSAMLIAGIGTLIQLFPIFHKVGPLFLSLPIWASPMAIMPLSEPSLSAVSSKVFSDCWQNTGSN